METKNYNIEQKDRPNTQFQKGDVPNNKIDSNAKGKVCSVCETWKARHHFGKNKSTNSGMRSSCLECQKLEFADYRKTENGWYSHIYSTMKENSKRRGHQPPNFTKGEFIEWIQKKNYKKFVELFIGWYFNDYDKWHKPSIDRIDDYKGYNFENMQLVTWEENYRKSRNSGKFRDNIENQKTKIKIVGTHKDTQEQIFFTGINEAGRNGFCASEISKKLDRITTPHKDYFWNTFKYDDDKSLELCEE